jgi:hypothetical protein
MGCSEVISSAGITSNINLVELISKPKQNIAANTKIETLTNNGPFNLGSNDPTQENEKK